MASKKMMQGSANAKARIDAITCKLLKSQRALRYRSFIDVAFYLTTMERTGKPRHRRKVRSVSEWHLSEATK